MSTIKSSSEHLTLNADGASKDIKLQTNGTERVIIKSDGNVGIGEQSVGAKLHVSHSDSSTDLTDANNIASFERNGNARLVIATNSANTGSLDFGDSGGARQGRVSYAHSNDSMQFFTSNTERMRIDSSGRVTMPNQPAFLAYGVHAWVTYASGQVFDFGGEAFDKGNDYNTSTSRFTAPVSGVYAFQYAPYTNTAGGQMAIKINGSDYAPSDTIGISSTENNRIFGTSILLNLSTNDYVQVGWRNGHSGNVYTSHSWFSGHLIG